VPAQYSIFWQVINTGYEAAKEDDLRGEICEPNIAAKRVRWERTSYKGTHLVEAFVVNDQGICKARSGRICVKVR